MSGQLAGWLDEGIAAALNGEKQRACDLLVRVVEADQSVEEAWLWLSRVVDGPSDRLIALENVLALNPGNTLARAGLERLLAEHPDLAAGAPHVPPQPAPAPGPAPAQADMPSWMRDLPATPAARPAPAKPPPQSSTPAGAILYPAGRTAMAPARPATTAAPAVPAPPPAAPAVSAPVPGIEDISRLEAEQLACPYCGRPTARDDKKCGACGKSLMIKSRMYEQPSGNLQWIVLLLLVSAGRGLLDLGLPFVLLYFTASWYPPEGPMWGSWPLPGAYPGDPTMDALVMVAWVTIGVILARTVIYLIVAWGLWSRITLFFYLVIAVTILDFLYGLWTVLQSGFNFGDIFSAVGGGFAVFGFLINAVTLWLVAGAWPDFQSRVQRILCRVDIDARDPAEQFRRGHLYRKHGMWGLAAVHYGAALRGSPDSLEFAKNYAIALSQTRRDQEAVDLLRGRQAQHPTDLQLPQMIELLQQKIAKQTR